MIKLKEFFIFIDEFPAVKDLGENLNSFLWYIRSYVSISKKMSLMYFLEVWVLKIV